MNATDVVPDPLADDPDRRGFYRGPGRGDGHRRRSLAWEEQRRVALTRACEHELVRPARRGFRGEREQRVACGAQVGELCRDPLTGEHLQRQAAHHVRIYPRHTPTQPTTEEPTP